MTGYVVTRKPPAFRRKKRNQLLFMKAVEVSDRPWLPDADLLIQNVEDLPEDAVQLGASLGLSEDSTLIGIRQVHGHIDLELRTVIGESRRACTRGSTRAPVARIDGARGP